MKIINKVILRKTMNYDFHKFLHKNKYNQNSSCMNLHFIPILSFGNINKTLGLTLKRNIFLENCIHRKEIHKMSSEEFHKCFFRIKLI